MAKLLDISIVRSIFKGFKFPVSGEVLVVVLGLIERLIGLDIAIPFLAEIITALWVSAGFYVAYDILKHTFKLPLP